MQGLPVFFAGWFPGHAMECENGFPVMHGGAGWFPGHAPERGKMSRTMLLAPFC